MSCGVGHRYGLDLVLLWLWCGPAATFSMRPLAWEPPYAAGVALKSKKKKKQKNKQTKKKNKPLKFCPLNPYRKQGIHIEEEELVKC